MKAFKKIVPVHNYLWLFEILKLWNWIIGMGRELGCYYSMQKQQCKCVWQTLFPSVHMSVQSSICWSLTRQRMLGVSSTQYHKYRCYLEPSIVPYFILLLICNTHDSTRDFNFGSSYPKLQHFNQTTVTDAMDIPKFHTNSLKSHNFRVNQHIISILYLQ